jgi:monoamine oxidase
MLRDMAPEREAETSPVWNGYMEGAVRSGERAADEVLEASG